MDHKLTPKVGSQKEPIFGVMGTSKNVRQGLGSLPISGEVQVFLKGRSGADERKAAAKAFRAFLFSYQCMYSIASVIAYTVCG